MSSLFACDKPRLAAKYLDAQTSFAADKEASRATPLSYAVEMDASSKQPMILVTAIANDLSAGDSDAGEFLAREYWTSTQPWSFWEYTSSKIVVLDELPWPDCMEMAIALQTYAGDSSLLKRFRAAKSKIA